MKIDLITRERNILRQVAAGNSDDEIAESLDLNVNIVKIHINLLCRVLKLRDRAQVAIWAAENLDCAEENDQAGG